MVVLTEFIVYSLVSSTSCCQSKGQPQEGGLGAGPCSGPSVPAWEFPSRFAAGWWVESWSARASRAGSAGLCLHVAEEEALVSESPRDSARPQSYSAAGPGLPSCLFHSQSLLSNVSPPSSDTGTSATTSFVSLLFRRLLGWSGCSPCSHHPPARNPHPRLNLVNGHGPGLAPRSWPPRFCSVPPLRDTYSFFTTNWGLSK